MSEQSTALPCSKTTVRFVLPFVWSHALAYALPQTFQPPGSKDSPTFPALACSCNGVSLVQPSTYRTDKSKSKNPARFSVVLALGESNNKTIDANQKSRLLSYKTTQKPAGFGLAFRLDATPDRKKYSKSMQNLPTQFL